MKIRVINQNDWERTYELDKSIIRIGSQISCDIQLTGNDIQPMHMQLVRAGGKEIKYILRTFADNVKITRGDQVFTGQQMVPYEVLDGDKLVFASYRIILSLEDEQTRVRSSNNMEAKMYIQKRDLSVDSPINGILSLKNTGTEKACQFRMQIRGIPDECLRSAPLPYLYPGGKSTVGFMISHLQTKPSPGFHTVSITLSAPDDYFGEVLEFRQDIYVNPVFKTEIVLEDDSDELRGLNKISDIETKQQEEPEPVASFVQETARMIPGQPVIEKEEPVQNAGKEPVVISGAAKKDVFADEDDEEEDSARRRRSNKKQKINVIRHDDEALKNAFEDEEEPADTVTSAESPEFSEIEEKTEPAPAETPAAQDTPEISAGPEEEPMKPKKSAGRRKKAAIAEDVKADEGPAEEPENIAEEPETRFADEQKMPAAKPKRKPMERTKKAAAEAELKDMEEPHGYAEEAELMAAEKPGSTVEEPEFQPEPVTATESEPQEGPEEAEEEPETAEEDLPDSESVSEPADVPETDEDGSETLPEVGQDASTEEVPGSQSAEEPETPDEVSEPKNESEEAEELPKIIEEDHPNAEAVPETGEMPEVSKEPELPAEEEPEGKAGMNMITGSGKAPIPVVHHNDSFEFTGEDDAPASLSEKEPEVRFVKRGNFDD